jgi:hypothetical protein
LCTSALKDSSGRPATPDCESARHTSVLPLRRLLERLGLPVPEGFGPEPLKHQSDGINDDWTRRYSELRLGTEFDLVPATAR